jgi:hypothetical protein
VVVGGALRNRASHHFNEILGYAEAALKLGVDPKVLLGRGSDAELTALLTAEPVLDAPPSYRDSAGQFVDRVVAYVDDDCPSYWESLERLELHRNDGVLFTLANPWLIRGVARWLASRRRDARPSVFVRFIGDEIIDLKSGRYNTAAALFRLAAADLANFDGKDQVTFFASSETVVRAVGRATKWRTVLMPLPKHFPSFAAPEVANPKTLCIFLNARSGSIVERVPEIVARLSSLKISVKSDAGVFHQLPAQQLREAGVELLEPDQTTEAYHDALSRIGTVLLAYEPQPYRTLTSGVLIEAAGTGKVVVVPAGTWLSEEIERGLAAGTTFASSTVDDIVEAVVTAVSSEPLRRLASHIAPSIRSENSSERVLEKLFALERQVLESGLVYSWDEEIDFSSALDSRGYMKNGWSQAESIGTWTSGSRAALSLAIDGTQTNGVGSCQLQARVKPFVVPGHSSLRVIVRVNGLSVANWAFDANEGSGPRWCVATFPVSVGIRHSLLIEFEIDFPTSPLALGLSSDGRLLGLCFSKVKLMWKPEDG